MKDKLIAFCKKETVFVVSAFAAVISAFLVPPSKEYLSYPDYRVLSLLFCLMIIVAGFKELGIFTLLGKKLTVKAKDSRTLTLLLVMLCFFSSMFITNDVALITFVPFGLELLQMAGLKEKMIKVVVLQTIAANLGSMFTPIGNPQNLYLYSLAEMGIGEFLLLMLPLCIISLFLLLIVIFGEKPVPIAKQEAEEGKKIDRKSVIVLSALFLVCLLNVVRILPFQVMLVIVAAAILFRNKSLYIKVDYCLLGTFLGFFIFVENMQRISIVKELLETLLGGRELYLSVLASQVISNVPAAMLLSGFTDQYKELIYGVNIGGLGTLIASLASVISYKSYASFQDAKKGKYMAVFTLYNLIFLVILLVAGTIF